ncbi:MAG: glycoside hydrolase family 38 C-terminal domain-containing protein [Gemmatimonadales bacterium]
MVFHLVPHTHWDREWYLTRSGFQARLVPVVDALLSQLERDPAARFVLDGQTILAEDYLSARPGDAERLAALVRRGALEVGPWYVLADLLIPAGESLIRNLLLGARDAARLGGRMDILYSPDAFGHPASLPVLAAEFGLPLAVIRRGLGRPTGGDRDFYRWIRGDASVIVYHLPRAGYEVAVEATRAGADIRREWAAVRRELVARSTTAHVIVFLGADHHPVVRDLAGFRDQLASLEPEHQVRVSGLGEALDAAAARLGADVSSIEGELRRIDGHTWVLQDVQSTRSRLKRHHARAELGLWRLAEPLAALAAWRGGRERRDLLRLAWRGLLQSQFHDTLGGSCTDGVHREQEVRLDGVETLAKEIAARSLDELADHDPDLARDRPGRVAPRLLLFNPAARERKGIVTAEITFFRRDIRVGPPGGPAPRGSDGFHPFVLDTPRGRSLPMQVLGLRRGTERLDAEGHHPDQDEVDRVYVAFAAPETGGLSVAALAPRHERLAPPGSGLEVSDGCVSNRLVTVEVSRTGLLNLTDRKSGERYFDLALLEDEPDAGDTYTFSRGDGEAVRGGRPGPHRVVAEGPLVGAVEACWTMDSAAEGDIGCRLVVVLHADSPIVRLRLELENGAVDHRLRARFPVRAGETALAGAALGVEQREPVLPDRRPGMIERPVLTAPAHRFVAAAQGKRGLAVLSPGFFEYEWTASRDLIVTLLRSVGELSRAGLPERPGHAGWPEPTPLAQELGAHTIDLALVPVGESDVTAALLERLWEDAFLPIQAVFRRDYAGSAIHEGSVSLEGDGLVFSAAKPPESGVGLVLRCLNATDEPRRGAWRFGRAIRSAVLVRADESGSAVLPAVEGGRLVPFEARPWQIVTVKVTPEAGR